MEATIGESAYANYEPDANTVGLWHLEEQNGSGAYIKDSSGRGNSGTPTGTTFAQGKIGKARKFNGISDYIDMGTSNLSIGSGPVTIEAWAYTTSFPAYSGIASYGDSGAGARRGVGLAFRDSTGNPTLFETRDTEVSTGSGVALATNQWNYIVGTSDASRHKVYVNGVLVQDIAAPTGSVDDATYPYRRIGTLGSIDWWFNGIVDEVRISNVARTADEIRQAYEIGRRTHPITIDFAAKLDSANLIADSADTSFTINATQYGAANKGDNLFVGDKVIVRENVNGTEYVAQGNVSAVTNSTGAVTVTAWDTGSTFPTGGFTANANALKWQREWFDVTGSLGTQRDAVTRVTLRVTDGNEGRNVWLDDIRAGGAYLTAPAGSTVNSTARKYFQYRAILSTADRAVSAYLTSVVTDFKKRAGGGVGIGRPFIF